MSEIKNDLALYLEASAYWHVIQLLADPSTSASHVRCACGWRSRPILWKNAASNLVPEVVEHLSEAIVISRRELGASDE